MPARHFAINPGFALALLGAVAGSAHAQVDTWVATNCTMLQTPARKASIEMCEGHAGCAIMLSTHKTCLSADKFLVKLDAATPPATPMLFGLFSRRVVTPEAVWEAHLSDAARAVESKPEWRARIDPIVRAIKPGMTEFAKRESTGFRQAYYGPTVDEKWHGYGTVFSSTGAMFRGEFRNGGGEGEFDFVAASGLRHVGTYQNAKFTGTGLVSMAQGSQFSPIEYRGDVVDGKQTGKGVLLFANGARWEGTFNDGAHMEGSRFYPDGTVFAKGSWDARGQAVLVETFDKAGQLISRLDVAKDRADAAKAQADAAQAQREAAEREKREQAAARILEEEQRREAQARADKDFRDGLAKLNAGELFTRSQDLRNAGNMDRAREMQRYLIERFPNHAMAAVAAQQLAGTANPAAAKPGAVAAAAPQSTVRQRSCYEQISDLSKPLYANDPKTQYPTREQSEAQFEHRVWAQQVFLRTAGNIAACKADPDMMKRLAAEVSGARAQCADMRSFYMKHESRSASSMNCEQGRNRNGDAAGVDAVIARLMATQGSPATAIAGNAGGTAQVAASGEAAEQACSKSLDTINTSFSAASAKIPKDSVVVYSEAFMWQLNESIGVVEKQCPNSENYRRMVQQWRNTLAVTRQVCDGSSSRGPCVARLPVSETAVRPAPTQVAAQRPLENKPPASCSDTSGANWLACQRQACAKVSGVLQVSGGCVACQAPGNSFNACLPGQGFNSAQ